MGPKILYWDLETTHNVVAAFNLYGKDYLPHDNILQERFIVCASWKWAGDKKVHSVSTLDDPKRFKKNPADDFHVVKAMSEAINDSDIIVAHNGDRYDSKFLKGRMLTHGMKPLAPVQTIDTYKVAKNHFLLNSNRLDYIAKLLGVGQKQKTSPGLWLRVLGGDKKAIQEMVDYNKVDVEILERVFNKLLPYVPNINRRLYDTNSGCTTCGSQNVNRRGSYVAITRSYQRFVCKDCGKWFKDDKPEASTLAKGL